MQSDQDCVLDTKGNISLEVNAITKLETNPKPI